MPWTGIDVLLLVLALPLLDGMVFELRVPRHVASGRTVARFAGEPDGRSLDVVGVGDYLP